MGCLPHPCPSSCNSSRECQLVSLIVHTVLYYIYRYSAKRAYFIVISISHDASPCVFSLAIAFQQRTTHHGFDVGLSVQTDRGTSCDHKFDVSTEAFFYFGKYHTIIESVAGASILPSRLELGLKGGLCQTLFDSTLRCKLSLDCVNKSIVYARH